MAGVSEWSHTPRVLDIQTSQACNGRRVTVGQDQTLEMDEVSFRSTTAGNQKDRKVTLAQKGRVDPGGFKTSDVVY